MGIKERRAREKGITKQAILTAALQIAQLEGWPTLTIRKVGERIEYSPSMVYEYFESKEDILIQLIRDGFRQLQEAMQQAYESEQDREQRMLKMADAYWNFAITNRELYQLMHGLGGVPLDMTSVALSIEDVCALTQMALLDWADEYHVKGIVDKDPLGATEILWSLLHGLVSLSLVERVKSNDQRALHLMHEALRSQLIAWKSIR